MLVLSRNEQNEWLLVNKSKWIKWMQIFIVCIISSSMLTVCRQTHKTLAPQANPYIQRVPPVTLFHSSNSFSSLWWEILSEQHKRKLTLSVWLEWPSNLEMNRHLVQQMAQYPELPLGLQGALPGLALCCLSAYQEHGPWFHIHWLGSRMSRNLQLKQ